MVGKKGTEGITTKERFTVANGYIIGKYTFDDARVKLIESLPAGDEALVIFFRMLSVAAKSEAGGFLVMNGNIPYNDEMLAIMFDRSLPRVRQALKTLIEFGMIRETEDGLKVSDFVQALTPEVQERENVRARVDKHRKQQAALEEPKPKKPKREYAEDSIEMKLSKYLFSKMRENNPEAKEPNFQSWANEIRLMIERDGRTAEQIKNMINWSQKDSFWKGNILSTKKLRDKYDQLKVRALEEWQRSQNQGANRGGRQQENLDLIDRLMGGEDNDLPRSIEGY
jgi:predicted phage replisome organizer